VVMTPGAQQLAEPLAPRSGGPPGQPGPGPNTRGAPPPPPGVTNFVADVSNSTTNTTSSTSEWHTSVRLLEIEPL